MIRIYFNFKICKFDYYSWKIIISTIMCRYWIHKMSAQPEKTIYQPRLSNSQRIKGCCEICMDFEYFKNILFYFKATNIVSCYLYYNENY